MKSRTARFCALACLATIGFSNHAAAENIYGTTQIGSATSLVSWDTAAPATLTSQTVITGLQSNETLLGIDMRPATGQLYGLGSSNRLYSINALTGAATAVGAPFSPALSGAHFGFDFDPETDRIRIVSDANINRMLNPNTGQVSEVLTDLLYNGLFDPMQGVDPVVVHTAYDYNVPTSLDPRTWVIDSSRDVYALTTRSTGAILTPIFPLGADIDAVGGFDIMGELAGYAALQPAGSSASEFYSIDIANAEQAVSLGPIGGGLLITGMTIAPLVIPEPATLALLSFGLIGCVFARRNVSCQGADAMRA